MEDIVTRFWEDLSGRISGPFSLRIILQPTVAALLAIKSGLADAKAGRPAYFWAVLVKSEDRRALLRDGWKSMGNVFLMAVVLDVVYQLIVFRGVYALETLVVAFVLACVPYLLIRGPVNRIARSSST